MGLISKIYFKYISVTNKAVVKIPNWIREIPTGVFKNNSELRAIYFPNSIREIKSGAVSNCQKLNAVYFSSDLIDIATDAFELDKEITVFLPKSTSKNEVERINRLVNRKKVKKSIDSYTTNKNTINDNNTISDSISNFSESNFSGEDIVAVSENKNVEEITNNIEKTESEYELSNRETESEYSNVIVEETDKVQDTMSETIENDISAEDIETEYITKEKISKNAEISEENYGIIENECVTTDEIEIVSENNEHIEEIEIIQDVCSETNENGLSFETSETEDNITGAYDSTEPVEIVKNETDSIDVIENIDDFIVNTEESEFMQDILFETADNTISIELEEISDNKNEIDSVISEEPESSQETLSESMGNDIAIENAGIEEIVSISTLETEEVEDLSSYIESSSDVEQGWSAENDFVEDEIIEITDISIIDSAELTTEQLEDKNEPIVEPEYEEFEQLELEIPEKKSNSEPTRKNRRHTDTNIKRNIRETDLKKYTSSVSVTQLKTDDKLISSLLEKYRLLENKYGSNFPIGLIDVSKEEYSVIASCVKEYIQNNTDITLLTSLVCTVFLVKTAENYDISGTFWISVASLINCSENESTEYLKKSLLKFCVSERKYFHYYDNRRSYAGTVMIHTVISCGSLDETLQFVKNFYIEEMNEGYSDRTVDKYLDLFIDEMSRDSERDSIEKGDLNGIYRLPFNFKIACREFRDSMKDILKCLVYNIDAYYHRTSDASYSPAVVYKYFKRWKIKDILNSRTNKSAATVKEKKSVTSKNQKQVEKLSVGRKCSYFIDEDETLYLYIPQFEIPSDCSEGNVQIRLFNGGTALTQYNQNCEVLGIFRFHTEEITLRLDKFYKDLSLRLVAENEEILFDSKSQLLRTNLIFDSNLTEYTFKRIPEERFYILTSKEDVFFADANYNSYAKSNYIVHSLDVENNCIITVNNNNVFKLSEDTDVVISVDSSNMSKTALVYYGGNDYRVYSDIPELNFECDENKSEEYIIDVNELHINIDDILNGEKTAKIKLSELINARFVSVVLRKKGSLRHLGEWKIAVLKNFDYSLDKEYYYDEKNIFLEDLYADDVEFDIIDYPCTFSVNRTRRISINASADGVEFYVDIKIPVVYWEFNDDYNSFSGKKYIHVSEIKDIRSFFVDIPVNDTRIMAVNENVTRIVDVSNGRADISDFKISNAESTIFGLAGNKTGQLKLFEIIYSSAIRELSVVCNDDELNISYIRIGICPLTVIIKDGEDNTVFTKSYSSGESEERLITEDISELVNGRYTAEVYIIKADDFGFSTAKKLVGTFRFVKGNPLELYLQEKNNLLKPEYCFGDDDRNRVNNFYCESIHKLDSESEIYYADAYFFNRYDKKVYFKTANPMRIEFLERNDKLLTFLINDRDGDGLLYEKARGYLICDSEGSRDYSSYSLPDYYAIKI